MLKAEPVRCGKNDRTPPAGRTKRLAGTALRNVRKLTSRFEGQMSEAMVRLIE